MTSHLAERISLHLATLPTLLLAGQSLAVRTLVAPRHRELCRPEPPRTHAEPGNAT